MHLMNLFKQSVLNKFLLSIFAMAIKLISSKSNK